MKKIINVVIPLFFILMGIGCLTLSSTVFHSHNALHELFESFIGICIFLAVSVALGVLYIWVNKKKNQN